MNAIDPIVMAPPPGTAGRRGRESERMIKEGNATRYAQVQFGLGALALIAALLLVIVGGLNRSLQADVAAGQAKIANAQAAANVNNTLIRLLAKAAAEKNDEQIRTLLSQNGISFHQGPAAGTDAAAPAAPAK